MIKIKSKYLLFLAFFFLTSNALAKNPSDLIVGIVDEASSILSSGISETEKISKLNAIAEENVDIEGIGFYTLGKYRKSISEDEKNKYTKLFKSYFLKSFSSRLVTYTDPKINVISE